MKRDIKFRGRHSHNGEWAYGNLIVAENGTPYIFPREICEVDGHHLRQGDDAPHWVDPATVGQFTGLTDKNGKEIFEGDVIEVVGVKGTIIPCGNYASDYHTVGARLLVKWFPSGFMLTDNEFKECSTVGNVKQYDFWNKSRSLIVIGNIHDDQELLKNE